MTTYIRFPIETNPNQLALDVYNYIKARSPQWVENDGNLDTWIIQAMSTLAAELRDLASNVPDDIFRFFGATLMAIPPIDAAMSTVFSTWTMTDNAGYTIPAGTQVAIRDLAGNLIAFETLLDVVIPAGSIATGAGAVQLRSIDPGAFTAGLGGLGVAAQLLDTLAYVSTIILTDITAGGVDAEDDDTYLNRLARNLRLLSMRPILPGDFAILARNIAGVYRAVAIDGYNPFHNLLTLNEASAETDASGWSNSANTTISSTAAQAADGTKSVGMTAIASADMVIRSPVASNGVGAKPCIPGETITGIVSIRANTTVRSCRAEISFFTAAGAFISTASGPAAADSAAAFTAYACTAVAPATAAFCAVRAYVIAPVGGELHYVDKASIRRGTTTDWVPGGTPDVGNARTISVAAIDANGADVSGPIQTAIQVLLAANREVTFLTYVVGAKRTAIDVTFAAKANAGYTTADVQARAIAAVQGYLSSITWGNSSNDPQDWIDQTIVRYSEIAQVISNTEGLDYWTTLTIGLSGGALATADVTIPSPAALATAGVITGVVT